MILASKSCRSLDGIWIHTILFGAGLTRPQELNLETGCPGPASLGQAQESYILPIKYWQAFRHEVYLDEFSLHCSLDFGDLPLVWGEKSGSYIVASEEW